MDRKKKSLKSSVVDSLELPKDIVYGAVLVTITGQQEVVIENYKGILEYTDESARIQAKGCILQITGKNLLITSYSGEEMRLTGFITEIIYESL